MQDKNQLYSKTQVKIIMHERSHRCSDQSYADGTRRRNGLTRRNVLANKIGVILSCACGSSNSRRRRRAQKMCFYTGADDEEEEEEERPISEEHGLALNKTHSCEEIQVAKVHASGTQRGNGRNCKKRYRRRRLTASFSKIFRKSSTAGFSLRKWKAIKIGNAKSARGSGLKPSYGRIVSAKAWLKRDDVRGVKTTLVREEALEAEEAKTELELCKKRILMGEKCRPLNLSGVLHYDEEGILLPEDVLSN